MNIEDYRTYCLSLGEDVEEKLPFTAFHHASGVLVFYVHGHMFSFFDCDDFSIITLKCHPERIEELKARYDCIGNPFNESPKYWIGIDANTAPDELLQELTRNSYEIVKAKYKKNG
ncbi:MAG: MmcQ/YjbR family DNA-binding protein [Bacteroidaceae bacterium]|nr:MmcQ/YjbR family DNA-binding protein [Bacteroidaceae bacterium]